MSEQIFNFRNPAAAIGFMSSARPKTHDYTSYQAGQDYMFDLMDAGTTACMTGMGRGIRLGDHLILRRNSRSEVYEVIEIDYYANPSDAWVARLLKTQ